MILYVNGDSHAAAAEAVNPYSWAEDDGLYYGLGQQPHPDNERVSFGCEIANSLNAILYLVFKIIRCFHQSFCDFGFYGGMACPYHHQLTMVKLLR